MVNRRSIWIAVILTLILFMLNHNTHGYPNKDLMIINQKNAIEFIANTEDKISDTFSNNVIESISNERSKKFTTRNRRDHSWNILNRPCDIVETDIKRPKFHFTTDTAKYCKLPGSACNIRKTDTNDITTVYQGICAQVYARTTYYVINELKETADPIIVEFLEGCYCNVDHLD